MAAPNIVNVSTISGKTAVQAVSPSPTAIVTNSAASGKVYKVNSLLVGNVDGINTAEITIDLYRSSTAYHLIKTASITAGSTLDLLAKTIYLEEGDSIRLTGSASSDLEAVCSYEEIESTDSDSGLLTADNNLNDLSDATTARQNLGVEIGVDVQAFDADTTKNDVANTFTANQTISANLDVAGTVTADQYNNDEVRHSIRPSLLLDFANSKRLDPRITFTRSSTATYYDGKTFAKAEENLLTYSQEFNSGSWSNVRATYTNDATTAPDGTTTAYDLQQATGETLSGDLRIASTVPVSSGIDYTFSVFVKANGKNFITVSESLYDATLNDTWFNLSTGAVGTTNAAHTASIEDIFGDGTWYRCSITFTPNATRTASIYFRLADTDGSTVVTDSGGVYLWGAQLEQRSSVTAYTPTTTQPITNYIPVLQTAASGAARFDHDPITGESKGLLIEEQRTNLLTYSEDIANAAWGKGNSSVTSNIVVAPDGTLTGDKIISDTSTIQHQIAQSITFSQDTTYAYSVFVKSGGRTSVGVGVGGNGKFITTNFNLSTLTFSDDQTGGGTIVSKSYEDVGNGWYRVFLVFTTDSSGTVPNAYRISDTAFGVVAGDGYSGIYIWGAQLEEGSFPTSYIKTTSAQVTRNADSASMTGTNFSSWYRQDEGTVYSDYGFLNTTPNDYSTIFELDDGSSNNRIFARYPNYNTIQYGFVSSGSYEPLVYISFFQAQKIVIAYKVNDFAALGNGGSASTDTSGIVPSGLNGLYIGDSGSGFYMNGHIKKLAYYPKRLTNAELQALTEA